MIPALDPRLTTVLDMIRAETHADIGADHAHLPIRLIQTGRVKKCIVVELNSGPLAHARQNVALAGLSSAIEVRAGDGFGPLQPGEVQSAGLSGMGTRTILAVLNAAGKKLPPALVLQPNDSPKALRVWAQAHGFHLAAEALAAGFWSYPILRLERRPGPDPSYGGLPPDAALRYGPQLLRAGSALIRRQVWDDLVRLAPLAAPGRSTELELREAQQALDILGASKRQ